MGGRLLLHGKLAFVSFFFSPACFRLWEFGFLKETEQEEEEEGEEGCGTIGKSLVANENVRRQIFFCSRTHNSLSLSFTSSIPSGGIDVFCSAYHHQKCKKPSRKCPLLSLSHSRAKFDGTIASVQQKEGVAKGFLLFPECRCIPGNDALFRSSLGARCI